MSRLCRPVSSRRFSAAAGSGGGGHRPPVVRLALHESDGCDFAVLLRCRPFVAAPAIITMPAALAATAMQPDVRRDGGPPAGRVACPGRSGRRGDCRAAVVSLMLSRPLRGPLRRLSGRRDRHLDQLFDVAEKSHLVPRAQRDRDALRAGARGAADAVHVTLRNVRQIVVDDVTDAFDVDAAGGDVGRDQRADLPAAKIGEHALALALRLVAVDRGSADAALFKSSHHLISAVLGAREHQRAVDRFGAQQVGERGLLGAAVHVHHPLRDALDGGGGGRYRNRRRVLQHLLGEVGDILRHGGREQQRLPNLRQLRHDLPDVVDEAHIEHAVGFVEHERFDRVEPHRVALHQIEQAAWRRHQHVDPVEQRADLLAHRDAADRQRGLDAQVAAVGAEAVEDLTGEFARRAEHQHAAGLALGTDAVGGDAIENRQRERGGLAGAGLCDADQVAAADHQRNSLILDGGGSDVLLFSKGTCDRLCEAEVVKRVQFKNFL